MSFAGQLSRNVCLRCEARLMNSPAKRLRLAATIGVSQSTSSPRKQSDRLFFEQRRGISHSRSTQDQPTSAQQSYSSSHDAYPPPPPPPPPRSQEELEVLARDARNRYGDYLPTDLLDEPVYNVYERLYGKPLRFLSQEEITEQDAERQAIIDAEDEPILLKFDQDGMLQEVEADENEDMDAGTSTDGEITFNKPKAGTMEEVIAALGSENASIVEAEEETEGLEFEGDEDEGPEIWPGDEYIRSDPITVAGRFGTTPSTVQIPKDTFGNPVAAMLSNLSRTHLTDVAQRAMGGPGLPYSPSTPKISRSMQQKPVTLSPFQDKMTEMQADIFCATVMPQMYAAVTSVLVEVRKRLGKEWLEELLAMPGGPQVFDAGSGGAAVLAWRDVLRAEWEAMQEEAAEIDATQEKGSTNGKPTPIPLGKATVVVQPGTLQHRASRLLENTSFIPRLPDYIDSVEQATTKQPRKQYDVVIVPYALWRIDEPHIRKQVLETYWSLLKPDGGLLVLVEKGVPRGFEVIASARDQLLRRHIQSPHDVRKTTTGMQHDGKDEEEVQLPSNPNIRKEKAMIIAPCTNHVQCPLYKYPGVSKGRKDWCYFSQRYIRPTFHQAILGAKSRNHDDVEFSYLAVQRGRDLRAAPEDAVRAGEEGTEMPVIQGERAAQLAFEGYGPPLYAPEEEVVGTEEANTEIGAGISASPTTPSTANDTGSASTPSPPQPHPLSLPRTLLTPLKRKGHILLDVCTPSGTLERWLLNRRLGKAVYRDARKSKWGDLWGLGAFSRSERRVDLGVPESHLRAKKKTMKDKAGKAGGKTEKEREKKIELDAELRKGRRWARKGKEAQRLKDEGRAVAEDILDLQLGQSAGRLVEKDGDDDADGAGGMMSIREAGRKLEEMIERDEEHEDGFDDVEGGRRKGGRRDGRGRKGRGYQKAD